VTRGITSLLLLALLSPTGLVAQEDNWPAGWRWRLDRPAHRTSGQAVSDTAWRFDQMAPGWHLTTGPAGIFYPEDQQASGHYSLTADFVVFPETTSSGFGLFAGGYDLESDSPTYVAALLRRDGSVAVTRTRAGAESVVVPWTQHLAIKRHEGRGVITNRLHLNVSADSVRVFVNDSSVVRIELDNSELSGHFGFRVGERVNLHLTILDHTRHLAPARSRE
jgi:hypothetical protein